MIYELYGSATQESAPLQGQFEEFSEFLNLCVTSPENAEAILRQHQISDAEVIHVLSRYAKEARRIQVDLKHEREQKVLIVRQRLESELVDRIPGGVSSEAIESLIDLVIPRVLQHRVPTIVNRVAFSVIEQVPTSMTVNINPQFVRTVNAVVAREISGDLSFNDSDDKLLRLFAEYAGEQHSQLVSALRELKDESVPDPSRMTAKQKILSFLRVIGTKTADVAVGILQSYIEKKMLGL